MPRAGPLYRNRFPTRFAKRREAAEALKLPSQRPNCRYIVATRPLQPRLFAGPLRRRQRCIFDDRGAIRRTGLPGVRDRWWCWRWCFDCVLRNGIVRQRRDRRTGRQVSLPGRRPDRGNRLRHRLPFSGSDGRGNDVAPRRDDRRVVLHGWRGNELERWSGHGRSVRYHRRRARIHSVARTPGSQELERPDDRQDDRQHGYGHQQQGSVRPVSRQVERRPGPSGRHVPIGTQPEDRSQIGIECRITERIDRSHHDSPLTWSCWRPSACATPFS